MLLDLALLLRQLADLGGTADPQVQDSFNKMLARAS